MRTSPTTRKNNEISIILLLFFVVPFVTTFLLDIELIKQNVARTILVYLLLFVEIIIIILLFINSLKTKI